MTDSSQHPLAGLGRPTHLERLCYGPESVEKHLLDCLAKDTSTAFIIAGNSLATKTTLIKQVEELLGDKHAGTFSKIGQHAPVEQLDEAKQLLKKDSSIDTIISIGGGSPIDYAKAISYLVNEHTGNFLRPHHHPYHPSVPQNVPSLQATRIRAGLKAALPMPAWHRKRSSTTRNSRARHRHGF